MVLSKNITQILGQKNIIIITSCVAVVAVVIIVIIGINIHSSHEIDEGLFEDTYTSADSSVNKNDDTKFRPSSVSTPTTKDKNDSSDHPRQDTVTDSGKEEQNNTVVDSTPTATPTSNSTSNPTNESASNPSPTPTPAPKPDVTPNPDPTPTPEPEPTPSPAPEPIPDEPEIEPDLTPIADYNLNDELYIAYASSKFISADYCTKFDYSKGDYDWRCVGATDSTKAFEKMFVAVASTYSDAVRGDDGTLEQIARYMDANNIARYGAWIEISPYADATSSRNSQMRLSESWCGVFGLSCARW